MQTAVHTHIQHWLEASLKGRLTRAQRLALREHLAACPACQRLACDPAWVSRAADLLTRRAAVSAELEADVLQRLRSHSEDGQTRRRSQRQRRWRVGIRVGLLGILVLLLAVRSRNVRYVSAESGFTRAASATTQIFLREPRYDTLSGLPPSLGPDERTLAVAHQLVKGCVGLLLWLCIFLLGGLSLLDLWRRARRLDPAR